MEHQNKNTVTYYAYVSSEDTYKDFHNLYKHIQLAFVGDFVETPQLDELVDRLYWAARGELNDLHAKDDEYGTDTYLGKNMDYDDCEYGLLEAVRRYGFDVVPVFYDGELNSVVLKEVEPVRHVFTEDFDELLPF
jgi:hypothetical protein